MPFNDFISELSTLLDSLYDTTTPIVIAGDINIHVESLFQNSEQSNHRSDACKLYQLLDEYDLKQYIETPTHEQGGTLDLLIMSKCDPVSLDFSIGLKNQVCMTDHFHISMNIKCKASMKSNKITLHRRDLSNLNSPKFLDNLNSSNLYEKVICADANVATDGTSGTSGKFTEKTS